MRGRSFTDDGFDPKTLDVVVMIFLAVVAAMLLYTLWKYLRCSKETVGTIVDIEPLHGAGGSVRKRLTISFQTQAGPAQGAFKIPAGLFPAKKGDLLVIKYDPKIRSAVI